MPEPEDPKEPEKVTNNDLRNSQNAGGVVNADTVNAQRIGGDILNIRNLFVRQRDSSQSVNPRSRVQLLKQVRTEVESRLNHSLHNRIYIVQDTEQNPSQIELPWASEIKVGSKPKVHLTNTQITAIYYQGDIAGRLLILGEPGVGKTTMLLKLAEELVNRAKDDSTQHIPVLFSLSSWKDDKLSIKEWLVDQLKEKYGVRKDIGKQLINNQEIIPLLDGLDELAAERQEKSVIKINDFLQNGWSNPLVVCSRIEEYQRYKALLQLNNSLELHSFTLRQVEQYLQRTENVQLWNGISQDEDLKKIAQIPLLLSIIVLSAQELSISKWQQFQLSEERLNYLFDAYIERMLKRKYKDKKNQYIKQPKQENIKRWLGWLAQQLIEESKTEFLIEGIKPDWLKNKIQKILYNLIVWGVIGALMQWSIYRINFMGLFNKLSSETIFSVIYEHFPGEVLVVGLISGLIYGLIYGLFGDFIVSKLEKIVLSFSKKNLKFSINMAISSIILGVSSGLISGLISGEILGVISGLISGEISGLNIGLIKDVKSGCELGLLSGIFLASYGNKIQLFGTLKYSYKKESFTLNGLKDSLISGARWGVIGGGIFGVIFGMVIGVIEGLMILDVIFGMVIGVIFGMVIGVILGVMYGVSFWLPEPEIEILEIENKTYPNQGILLPVINTIKSSAVIGLLATLIFSIIRISRIYEINNQVLIDILVSGIAFGIMCVFSIGIPAFQHFILRVILWSNGYIPWNYAKFLDYCTNRLFLQRVGGGYRFMHDLLRQHFANSYTQKNLAPVPAIPVEPSLPVQNHIVCTNCGHNNSANNKFCINCGIRLH